jgi:hypothetical protein
MSQDETGADGFTYMCSHVREASNPFGRVKVGVAKPRVSIG